MAHVQRLTVFLERLGEPGLELIAGVLKHVFGGKTDLILACVGQIPGMAALVTNKFGDEGYKCLIQDITSFLTQLVHHEEGDVREMARSKLGNIAVLMKPDDRSNHVLKVCLELVQEQQREANKVAGLKLLGQLAGLFEKEFVQGFVVTQLTALSYDPIDNVRVVTIDQFAEVSSLILPDVVERKFAPEFKRLSKDPNWQVRLKFIEKAVILANNIPMDKRNNVFGEIFLSLLKDKTRWVKEVALKQLGYFLALLDEKNKNPKLFEEYLIIPKTISSLSKETKNSICFAVAETLPKIILNQGESTWKALSALYKQLLKQDESSQQQDEVRIELAKNIHKLSESLKKPEYKTELLNIMKKHFLAPTAGTLA